MISKFFISIWKILFGVTIKEYIETRFGSYVTIEHLFTARPRCDHHIYKFFNTNSPDKIVYKVLCTFDGSWHKIDTSAYEKDKRIIQL